jgi:hypothetical protein
MRRMGGTSTRSRGLVRRLAAILTGALLGSSLLALATPAPAQALSGGDFTPGMIISDSLFYDGNAMSEAQIQQFLASKGSGLAGYTFSVNSRSAVYSSAGNLRCKAFDGGQLAASTIIYRAQVACGISAKVLLVTLQKEQGLVTKSAPSQSAMDRAMGYACPDTAPCAATTLGFGNQVYSGALQFITYKVSGFARQPGWNSIGFSPNAACGATTLYLQNYATAALYNYTPYQPNAAALANLSGTGDGCSSYGNRNFWVYYNSWFGSTIGPSPYPISGPTITGTTTIGQSLTAVATWSGSPTSLAYVWLSCSSVPPFVLDTVPNGCRVIAGVTGDSYVSSPSDIGTHVGVMVTATNSFGAMTTGTVMSGVMGAPANTVLPSVSGDSSVGSTWSVTTGGWTGSPTFGIFWLRCSQPQTAGFGQVPSACVAIPGANGSTYQTTSNDLGRYITAQVAGSNSVGFGLAGAISKVPLGFPVNTVLPSISGAMVLGTRLTLDTGTWAGTPSPTFGIFWLRCTQPIGTGFTSVPAGCSAIAGANAASYVVTVADLGTYLTAQVAGSNSQGYSLAGAISTVKADGSAPVNTVAPSVSGAASAGSAWTVSTGTWTGSPSFGIFWLRCGQPIGTRFTTVPAGCAAIAGANSTTYVATSADAGKYLTAQIAGSNALGFSLAGAISTTPITASTSKSAPVNTVLPSVSGAASVGSTWTLSTGTWAGSPSFGLFWLRCGQPVGTGFTTVPTGCTAIAGANSATYVATSADAGKYLTAQVAGSNAVGFSLAGAVSTTAITAVAVSVPQNTAPPVLAGSTVAGSKWSVSTGAWTGSPAFGVFWLRCDKPITAGFGVVPAGCTAIGGANGPSYASTSTDVGKYLTAQIAATNSSGFTLAGALSGYAVQAAPASPAVPVNVVLPTVVGASGAGSTWTVNTGVWQGAPTLGIFWLRCDQPLAAGFTQVPSGCTAISGANSISYQSVAADVGKYLTAQVAGSSVAGFSLAGAINSLKTQ